MPIQITKYLLYFESNDLNKKKYRNRFEFCIKMTFVALFKYWFKWTKTWQRREFWPNWGLKEQKKSIAFFWRSLGVKNKIIAIWNK